MIARLATVALLCASLVAPHRAPAADRRIERLAAAIDARSTDAMTYLAEKLRINYVVGLGEDHWIKDHPLFLCEALRTLARDSTVNVDVLAVEFGNSVDQPLADEFVASPTYRHDLVVRILQNAPDAYGNPYKEYADIFRAVWESNRSKPAARRTRILLLDPAFVLDVLDGKPARASGTRDDGQFALLRSQLLRKRHVIFYCGLGHVERRIWGQYVPQYDIYYNWLSAGYLLKACYPDRVCLVELWGARMGSDGYIPRDDALRWERLHGGDFDAAFRLNGNRPVGFDLKGPALDTVTMARHFSDPAQYDAWDARADKQAPYSKRTLLGDCIDGILFVGPVEHFSGMTVTDDLYDPAFVERVAARLGDKGATREAIFRYIRSQHPIMGESLDELIAAEERRTAEEAAEKENDKTK